LANATLPSDNPDVPVAKGHLEMSDGFQIAGGFHGVNTDSATGLDMKIVVIGTDDRRLDRARNPARAWCRPRVEDAEGAEHPVPMKASADG
jgi:hypothetical protein